MIKELVKKNRSYRRFYQEKKLTRQQLMELVETARLTPSAANRQPFKYRIVCDEEENEKVFRLLGFAGYLKDWDGPSEGEKPTGYIVITCPANVNDGNCRTDNASGSYRSRIWRMLFWQC